MSFTLKDNQFRVQANSLKHINYGEYDSGVKFLCAGVIAYNDASPVIGSAELTLGTTTLSVTPFIISDDYLCVVFTQRMPRRVPLPVRPSRKQSSSYPRSTRNLFASGKLFILPAIPA